jgi:hypothetical protein
MVELDIHVARSRFRVQTPFEEGGALGDDMGLCGAVEGLK